MAKHGWQSCEFCGRETNSADCRYCGFDNHRILRQPKHHAGCVLTGYEHLAYANDLERARIAYARSTRFSWPITVDLVRSGVARAVDERFRAAERKEVCCG